jgi:hypothetical protein
MEMFFMTKFIKTLNLHIEELQLTLKMAAER